MKEGEEAPATAGVATRRGSAVNGAEGRVGASLCLRPDVPDESGTPQRRPAVMGHRDESSQGGLRLQIK